ncbi:MAG: phage tail sheath C-terminal domain-containing protein [Pseudomonadota bacterium]
MNNYRRPGVYSERVDTANASRLLIRSDVPGFIGLAEKGPLDTPIPVDSFRQFQAHFGDYIGAAYLAYSVRAFFENGGRQCWVVRVASRDFAFAHRQDSGFSAQYSGVGARCAELTITDGSHTVWTIAASSEGSWGNRLSVTLTEEYPADTRVGIGHLNEAYAELDSIAANGTAGFERGSLIVIAQEDSVGNLKHHYRVVTYIDETQQRLYWQHPEPGKGLIYDKRLSGFDKNQPARIYSMAYAITVYDNGHWLTSIRGLSLIPEHKRYGPRVLNGYSAWETITQSTTQSTTQPRRDQQQTIPAPIAIIAQQSVVDAIPLPLENNQPQPIALTGGRDGLAALSIDDFIGGDWSINDSDLERASKRRGIATLEHIDEISLVAIPDIVIQAEPEPVYQPQLPPESNPCVHCPPPPEPVQAFVPPPPLMEAPPLFSEAEIYQVQAAMVLHCESRGDRFAIIDPPKPIAINEQAGIAHIRSWRSRFDSSYAALYYPWIIVIEPRGHGQLLGDQSVRAIPPSGHVLGQYALFDNETGVHRAPANRSLHWCQDLTLHTSTGQQQLLNPLHINVIRSEGTRGLRIMGARCLSSDTAWRYINVRRLLIMIRRTLHIISQWVVFEPNSAVTRNKLQIAIASYLNALLARGAFAGETPEQSYFIQCDEANNPEFQRNNGQLLAEVGVAPSKPFEFIVVRVGIQDNELDITELRDFSSAA